MSDNPKLVTEFEIDKGTVKSSFDNLEKEAAKSGAKIGDALSPKSENGGFAESLTGFGFVSIMINQTLDLLGKVKDATLAVVNGFLDIAKHAENIKQVNYQFDILSTRALGVGSNLKDAFVAAGKGLITNEDALKAANSALVELGDQANKLPELLDLARKASLINGQAMTDNFNSMVRAIETGSARGLRSVNIFVDMQKAVKDYAASIGVLPDKLTEAELQQVRLNAVMAKGNEAFKGVSTVKEVTPAFTRLGVASKEAGEAIYTAVYQLIAPALTSLATNTTEHLKRFTTDFVAAFGHDENEKRNATIEKLTRNIEYLKGAIAKPNLNNWDEVESNKRELGFLQAKLQNLKDIASAQTDDDRRAQARAGFIPEAVRAKMDEMSKRENPLLRFNAEELAKNYAEINAAISKGEDEALQIRLTAAQKLTDEQAKNRALDELDVDRQIQLEVDLETKIASLREQYSAKKGFDQKKLNELILIETQNANAKIEAIEQESEIRKGKNLLAIQNAYKSALVAGISGMAASIGTALAKGEDAFAAFKNGVVGIIADIIIAIGNQMIQIGIATEVLKTSLATLSGGMAIAAGFALVTFGNFLKASAGGALTSAATGGGVSAGIGGGVATSPGDITSLPTEQKPQAPQTQVNLNVNGNIIPRDRNFALELTDLVREAFDTQGVVAVTS